MFITPSFKKSLIVEQFQGNYLKETLLRYELTQKTSTRRKFQLAYESARSSLKILLSPLDHNHVCEIPFL